MRGVWMLPAPVPSIQAAATLHICFHGKNEKENRMYIEGLFLFLLEEEQLPLTPLSYTSVPGGHT